MYLSQLDEVNKESRCLFEVMIFFPLDVAPSVLLCFACVSFCRDGNPTESELVPTPLLAAECQPFLLQ